MKKSDHYPLLFRSLFLLFVQWTLGAQGGELEIVFLISWTPLFQGRDKGAGHHIPRRDEEVAFEKELSSSSSYF